ncbi:MAG TPA: hypothetical protein PKC39_14495 [Ferruginibacter sp.]|nr:hypothetical protein [Ferruginibacter sp.]HMP22165.1 hypothetical protein [Ferruginibacter sp.]
MRSVLIKERETLFDIAIVNEGAPEAALEYAFENGISITDYLKSGDSINVFETAFYDDEVVKDLRAKDAKPATGDTDDFINNQLFEGIGYWYINLDFVVS